MTFKELYLSGQIPFEEIDRYISRWNRSDDERTLAKYLGLNAEEEDVWIDDSDEALKEMLDKRERVAGTPVTLGKTDIIVNKNGFGALPIQRISFDDAKVLLRKAYDAGVRFFDTARFYTDSEEKIGYALSDVREHIYIATKTAATTAEGFWKDLETSLHNLKTDYVDIYQFHNPAVCPKPGDGSGLYEAMLEAKEQGKIRFIGITNHRMSIAEEAIESGLYDTLQFPFNYLSTEREIALAKACAEHEMGFIAMKGLSGGLLTNSAAIYAYMAQFENVLPIWGVQKESELDEFLSYIGNPPELTDELKAVIEKDQKELAGEFCRGCGYCMPCPAGIEINNCARMSLLLRRSPSARYLSPEGQAKMKKIEDCLHCGHCKSMCPYGLDTPKLLEENYKDYKEVLAGKKPAPRMSARGAFEQIDVTLIYAARTLGFSESRIFWRVILPSAMPGVLSGAILAFARGLGEFGATAMLAGNIAGKTQTLPLAIYSQVAAGKMSMAYQYVWIIVVISFLVVVLMNVLLRRDMRGRSNHKKKDNSVEAGGQDAKVSVELFADREADAQKGGAR